MKAPGPPDEREARAARNQALFRAVNDQLEGLNAALAAFNGDLTIACECADTRCIAMIDVAPADYEAVRAEPRQFIVLADHVVSSVEVVARDSESYVLVEKFGTAGEVAEQLADPQAERLEPTDEMPLSTEL